MTLQEPTATQKQIWTILSGQVARPHEIANFIERHPKDIEMFYQGCKPELSATDMISRLHDTNKTNKTNILKYLKHYLKERGHELPELDLLPLKEELKAPNKKNPHQKQADSYTLLMNLPPMYAAALLHKNREEMDKFFKSLNSKYTIKSIIGAFASENAEFVKEAQKHITDLTTNNINIFPTDLKLPSEEEIEKQRIKNSNPIKRFVNLLKLGKSWYPFIAKTYLSAVLVFSGTFTATLSAVMTGSLAPKVVATKSTKETKNAPEATMKATHAPKVTVAKTAPTTNNIDTSFTKATKTNKQNATMSDEDAMKAWETFIDHKKSERAAVNANKMTGNVMSMKTQENGTIKLVGRTSGIKEVTAPKTKQKLPFNAQNKGKRQNVSAKGLDTKTPATRSPRNASVVIGVAFSKTTSKSSLVDWIKSIEASSEYKYSKPVKRIINKGKKTGKTKKLKYIQMAIKAALKHGIDPVLFVNQMAHESVYFKPEVMDGRQLSPVGARGGAQFMEKTGNKYGLYGNDFFNPEKAYDAAARMMRDETKKYGSQVLALAAYNGGRGAIKFVQKKLGKSAITADQWLNFMQKRAKKYPNSSRSAWHNETRKYIEKIAHKKDGGNRRSIMVKKSSKPRKQAYIKQLRPTRTQTPAWNQSYAIV